MAWLRHRACAVAQQGRVIGVRDNSETIWSKSLSYIEARHRPYGIISHSQSRATSSSVPACNRRFYGWPTQRTLKQWLSHWQLLLRPISLRHWVMWACCESLLKNMARQPESFRAGMSEVKYWAPLPRYCPVD